MKVSIRPEIWTAFRQRARIWQVGALPGLAVMACVMMARLTGSLQPLEWMAFDALLRSRPFETTDPRIVIVGINEADIRAIGKYPIPDGELARLLTTIQNYQPRAIGLDIFRDVATDANYLELFQVFRRTPNLIGIEARLGSADLQIDPPPALPPHQVGLADTILDPDGKLRRNLLATKLDSGTIQYGLALRLAAVYLKAQGISMLHGDRASQPIRFGNQVLPRFGANTGGFIGALSGGNQILINFRSHPKPFPVVSMRQVLSGQIAPDLLRDRIVLIGTTAAATNNDTFLTAATKGTLIADAIGNPASNQYQLLYGVEHHAHATSQIISAVLDGRSLLSSWAESWEYVWISFWGGTGILVGLALQSPWKTLLGIGISSAGLMGIAYGMILFSVWIPLVPALLALWGTGLTTAFFDQRTRLLLAQREWVLKSTYDVVHNGPLQTLAAMLRNLGDDPSIPAVWRSQLHQLNQELRSVYESMHIAVETNNHDANSSITDLLYEVYETTMQRDLPGFNSIKLLIPPDFSVLASHPLTPHQKQGLCLFLQEALCNVGKHAIAANRLEVICTQTENCLNLRIIDNGTGSFPEHTPTRPGRGTEQAKEVAHRLRGTFQRRPNHPQGTICELTWNVRQPWTNRLRLKFPWRKSP